jgi:SagB-type dehydrogenase family enzyme
MNTPETTDPAPPSIGRQFMSQTEIHNLGPSDQQSGIAQPPLELPPAPDKPLIDLPAPADIDVPEISLRAAIERRRSVRAYAQTPLTLDELSFLLWCTQGVSRLTPGRATLRTVPSAGARHAFETFLLINNVVGLEPGLYRFIATTHQLQLQLADPEFAAKVAEACLGQSFITQSGATFLWTAVRDRMTWRYGERGYRYLHLDAGHVCQNLYLTAEAVGCGVCGIAAYDDQAMNNLLGLDGVDQFLIYLATVGKKQQGT